MNPSPPLRPPACSPARTHPSQRAETLPRRSPAPTPSSSRPSSLFEPSSSSSADRGGGSSAMSTLRADGRKRATATAAATATVAPVLDIHRRMRVASGSSTSHAHDGPLPSSSAAPRRVLTSSHAGVGGPRRSSTALLTSYGTEPWRYVSHSNAASSPQANTTTFAALPLPSPGISTILDPAHVPARGGAAGGRGARVEDDVSDDTTDRRMGAWSVFAELAGGDEGYKPSSSAQDSSTATAASPHRGEEAEAEEEHPAPGGSGFSLRSSLGTVIRSRFTQGPSSAHSSSAISASSSPAPRGRLESRATSVGWDLEHGSRASGISSARSRSRGDSPNGSPMQPSTASFLHPEDNSSSGFLVASPPALQGDLWPGAGSSIGSSLNLLDESMTAMATASPRRHALSPTQESDEEDGASSSHYLSSRATPRARTVPFETTTTSASSPVAAAFPPSPSSPQRATPSGPSPHQTQTRNSHIFPFPSPTLASSHRPSSPSSARAPASVSPAVFSKQSPPISWYQQDRFGLTRPHTDVLKCATAYFLASLWTFTPTLNRLLPNPTGAHLVATIAVYYNPAKSVGAMLEADRFCLAVSLFVSVISLAAVGTLRAADAAGSEAGDWAALFFWMGGAVGILAWLKSWVGKASFNTATSMGFIIMSTVIVKEGGLSRLLETLLIVLIGSTLSNFVCFSLWPHSATSKLQSDIHGSLASFATLLTLLTQTFLLDDLAMAATVNPSQSLQEAVDAHERSFTGLKKNLGEAKSEIVIDGRIRRSEKAYDAVVKSLTRLAQHLTGMRSGTGLQCALMKAQKEGRIVLDQMEEEVGHQQMPLFSPSAGGGKGKHAAAGDYFGEVGNGKGEKAQQGEGDDASEMDDEDVKLADDANLFAEVRELVGPELRSLTTACTSTLLKIRLSFSQAASAQPTCDFDELRDEVAAALKAFQARSTDSILSLYGGSVDSPASSDDGASSQNLKSSKESVFLVFYFIFTLDEFARELLYLLESMSEIHSPEVGFRRGQGYHGFVGWMRDLWLRGTSRRPKINLAAAAGGNGRASTKSKEPRRSLRKRMSAMIIPIDPSEFHPPPSFPKKAKDLPNTATNPDRRTLPLRGRISHTLWEFSRIVRRNDVKYGFKVGAATSLLAAPAFMATFKDLFREFRGEWALISFFATMAPTLGQTNFLSLHRVLGTLFGAVTAASVYSLFPENPVVLPVFGFFFSIPCFYYIVTKPSLATSGRFVLLTYNLTALYSYNDRAQDTPVWSIAGRRFAAVSLGVVWTLIVSRWWWPYAARKELRNSLSDFLIDLSYLYTRLVATFSGVQPLVGVLDDSGFGHPHGVPIDEESRDDNSATETTGLLSQSSTSTSFGTSGPSPLQSSVREFMAMELHLQLALIDLRSLLDAATKEPRLKGPFPRKLYHAILMSSQTMLDRFHSMRCVVNRDEWDTIVQRDFIRPVNRERRELVGNVLLYFSTLAAGFRLKTPLPPYLPPAESARVRLLDAVEARLQAGHASGKAAGGGARHLLFFSYVLAMKGVIAELEYQGSVLQDAFGVVGGDVAAFEALFQTSD